MKIEITDNTPKVKEEFESACLRALEKCGLMAEGYAAKLCPVDTGNLRNSITHTVQEIQISISWHTFVEQNVFY